MPSSHHPALLVAAAASVAAGLIHAAAAGSHAALTALSMLFAVTALAQLGWGAAALARPTTPVVAAGIGIHLVALGAWVTSRTVGISSIEGLDGAQAVAFQDGLAASLQGLVLLGAGLALASVTLPRIARAAVPALVAVLAVATVPAMAQPHAHGSHGGEAHTVGHDDHHETGPAADDRPEVAAPTAEELGQPLRSARFLGSGCDHDHDLVELADDDAVDHIDPVGTPDHDH